jgi:hypothetical protein
MLKNKKKISLKNVENESSLKKLYFFKKKNMTKKTKIK